MLRETIRVALQGMQGHFDKCCKCKRDGDLDRCAKCPRAYHPTCLKADERKQANDSTWECPVCVKARKIRRAEDAKTPIQRQEDDAVVSKRNACKWRRISTTAKHIYRGSSDNC